eukprot:131245-Amorphochlora_amoeboformis.AAC.1
MLASTNSGSTAVLPSANSSLHLLRRLPSSTQKDNEETIGLADAHGVTQVLCSLSRPPRVQASHKLNSFS